ncbi:importin-7-like [Diaphorina citri]|uniref:Importin-7-like n=1 Tax=Diaphorina citri TaxID=121845 RepID=A0A3Q0J898_DIACI|nr:importin-7-like [Diaphorina citri]
MHFLTGPSFPTDELSSDEDDIDEAGQEYLERLSQKIQKKSKQQGAGAPFNITSCFVTTEEEKESDDSSDDSDDEDYEAEETTLEAYTTPLDEESSTVDEYNVFKQVLYNLQSSDPQWYELLVRNLTPEQEKSLFDIVLLADQRKAAAESKRIEQSGGYTFVPTQEVPTSFNFGGQPLGR